MAVANHPLCEPVRFAHYKALVPIREVDGILAPPRPYRNRQPCAAWCFLRTGAGLIFVIVFSLFLISYLFKLFFSAQ